MQYGLDQVESEKFAPFVPGHTGPVVVARFNPRMFFAPASSAGKASTGENDDGAASYVFALAGQDKRVSGEDKRFVCTTT